MEFIKTYTPAAMDPSKPKTGFQLPRGFWKHCLPPTIVVYSNTDDEEAFANDTELNKMYGELPKE